MGRARAPWTRSFINGAKVLLAQLDPRSFILMRALATAFVLLGLAAGLLTLETTALGADDATETVRLEPGDNFVGWVADPIAIAEIFKQIPEAALIYRWDAESRTYRYAVRDGSATLETLQPGMAANIRIDGRKSVKWERPLTPAKGMVTLYSGENWVAWNGRDEWPLDQVARGIGSSLVSIEAEERGIVYQPGSGISEAIAPLNGESTLRRGDALRVTVNRDLRWLQPTGMMPNIVWVGDIPESVREEITADMRRLLDFFAEEFAIEPDFVETTALLFGSIDAAVRHAESGAEPRPLYAPDHLRSTLETGWQAEAQPWGFWAWVCGWQSQPPPDCHGNKAPTLAHELFHVLQDQLSTRHPHLSPTWMSEGTATWLNWRLPPEFGQASYEDQRQWTIDRVAKTSEPLNAGENGFYHWVYDLGSVVADRLVEMRGVDALLDFDRLLYPQSIGKERRWVQMPTWHEAFEASFGITVEAFYEEFEAWRATLPKPAQQGYDRQDDVLLTGTLSLSNGTPALGFIAFAQEYDGELPIGLERTAVVEEDGAFSLYVAARTIQHLRLTRDGCTLWLTTNSGLTMAVPQWGQYGVLDTRDLSDLNLTLPDGACENELRINVIKLRGDDRQLELDLVAQETGSTTSVTLGPSGTFTTHAPTSGEYRLRMKIGGCDLWYHEDGLVASTQSGQLLSLGEHPVTIEFNVPDDLCSRTISGRFFRGEGNPSGDAYLEITSGYRFGRAASAENGEFTIVVPESEDYVLSYWTGNDGCWIHYSPTGATIEWNRATRITVADEDVTDIEFIVPDDPSSLCR